MRLPGLLVLGVLLLALSAHADMPDYRAFPAAGSDLVLWVSSERGRAEPESQAAGKLAGQGVEVWSLDPLGAYFLPQLPRSMDSVPRGELAEWLRTALASGKRVGVLAVSRSAVPVLEAAALLEPAQRARLAVLLMYPNLYTIAEPLAEPEYLNVGRLNGLCVRVLQPRRSAATPWLPGLLDHLATLGAGVSHRMLENVREGYWARETPTEFEVSESHRMDELVLGELKKAECK